MTHGCTEPSSTLQPYAFAIAPHNITDPMGANANARITNSASKYQNHGNLLCGLPFITRFQIIGYKSTLWLVFSKPLSYEFSGISLFGLPNSNRYEFSTRFFNS